MAPLAVQSETAQALSSTVVRVVKILSSMKREAPRQHPAVDSSHYPLLFCVSSEPRRISSVAESIHSDVSTVSRQVSHLVQHGLLEKIGDPADGRAQLLSLSPTGRHVIEKLVHGRGQWFEAVLAAWSDEDVRAFERFLTRFGDDLESYKAHLHSNQTSRSGTTNGATVPNTSEPDHQTTRELAHER